MKKTFVRALASTLRAVGYEVRRHAGTKAKAKEAYQRTHAKLFAELGREPKHFGKAA